MSLRNNTIREEAMVFHCEGEQLLGIISHPATGVTPSGAAVVIVVGGPQYRVGSHRQFIQLARALAADGHHCLRFDYRGMGDSTGAIRSFEQVDLDIAAAIQALRGRCPELRKLALWGLCDGASAILLGLQSGVDLGQVDGIALANPWVRSAASQARTQVKHYYLQRLGSRDFWRKLVRGRVRIAAVAESLGALKRAMTPSEPGASQAAAGQTAEPYQSKMATAWSNYKGEILLLLSGEDYTAKEFIEHASTSPEWADALQYSKLQRRELRRIDHTFSTPGGKQLAADHTCAWLRSIAANA